MTHRQQSHAVGTFPTCPSCGREPRHILDGRRRPVGGHLLACSCGETAKHDTPAEAVAAWCAPRNLRQPQRLRGARAPVVRLVSGGPAR